MTDVAVTTVLENTSAVLLKLQRKLFPDVDKGFQDVLGLWATVLKDLDERKGKDLTVYNLERDIRHLVCRLQDVLETYLNKIKSKRGRSRVRKFIDNFKSFRMVDLEVEEINTRIMRLKSLNTIAVTNNEEERSQSANENPETDNGQMFRYHNTLSPEELIVGMDEKLGTLKNILTDTRHRVICIYGVGGIGKTTLAHMLYGDTLVQYHFDVCAWGNMGQDITIENVLGNMLNQLPGGGGADKINHSGRELETLKEHVYKSLKGRRYLVVLDAIWSLDNWYSLYRLFPRDENGSRLVLTTQLREVAKFVAEDVRDGIFYEMRFLSISESSELLWKKAFLGDLDEVDSFKQQIGEEVLKVCKGLPSAILAVGKVLATKRTLREWEMVLQDSNSLVSRGLPIEQIVLEQSVSALKFDDLPYRMKLCFLYLGLFPKGSKIEVELLYFLWMAERTISLDDCQNNETMMDLAERYLSNLVRRKMVEVKVEETPSLRKYKSCWVHEDMQDHCLFKGEEYFFKVLDFQLKTQRRADSYSSSLVRYPPRRMGLHLGKQDDRSSVDLFNNEIVNHLRSLILLNPNDLQMKLEWPLRMFDLKNYKMLRVLKFERVDFQERGLPRGITKLIYIRYLSLKGCILGELPSSIGNLSFLETLDLRVSSQIIIPNVLRKMEKLAYLYLPLMFKTPNNDKLYLGSLKELEILENFDTRVCNVADLFEMTNLRHLSMTVEGILEDLQQIVLRMKMTSRHAIVLCPSIKIKNFECYTEERHSVFRELLSCQILNTLHMDGHLGQLPPHFEISSSLTQIVLKGSQLTEDPMTTLDKLPELQVLILQDDAFVGKIMRCNKFSFKKLKHLALLTLHSLETLEVQTKAMPMLSILAVKNCTNLRILPHRLTKRDPPVTFKKDDYLYPFVD